MQGELVPEAYSLCSNEEVSAGYKLPFARTRKEPSTAEGRLQCTLKLELRTNISAQLQF